MSPPVLQRFGHVSDPPTSLHPSSAATTRQQTLDRQFQSCAASVSENDVTDHFVQNRMPLAGSNNSALSRLKANGIVWPGCASVSARMRAVTSLPAMWVTTNVSDPAGCTTS